MKVNCKNCGKSADRKPNEIKKVNNSFCSRSCAAKYNNKKYPKRKKEHTPIECFNCGNLIGRNAKKYCSQKCQHIYIRKEYIERWLVGEESGNMGGVNTMVTISRHVKKWLIENKGEKCEKCAWCITHPVSGTVPIQVNHIDGNAYNTIPENLELLCPNCHSLTNTYGGYNRGNGRQSVKQNQTEINNEIQYANDR